MEEWLDKAECQRDEPYQDLYLCTPEMKLATPIRKCLKAMGVSGDDVCVGGQQPESPWNPKYTGDVSFIDPAVDFPPWSLLPSLPSNRRQRPIGKPMAPTCMIKCSSLSRLAGARLKVKDILRILDLSKSGMADSDIARVLFGRMKYSWPDKPPELPKIYEDKERAAWAIRIVYPLPSQKK